MGSKDTSKKNEKRLLHVWGREGRLPYAWPVTSFAPVLAQLVVAKKLTIVSTTLFLKRKHKFCRTDAVRRVGPTDAASQIGQPPMPLD